MIALPLTYALFEHFIRLTLLVNDCECNFNENQNDNEGDGTNAAEIIMMKKTTRFCE